MRMWLWLAVCWWSWTGTVAQFGGITCPQFEEPCDENYCYDLNCKGKEIRGSSDGQCKCIGSYIRNERYDDALRRFPCQPITPNCVIPSTIPPIRPRPPILRTTVPPIIRTTFRPQEDRFTTPRPVRFHPRNLVIVSVLLPF